MLWPDICFNAVTLLIDGALLAAGRRWIKPGRTVSLLLPAFALIAASALVGVAVVDLFSLRVFGLMRFAGMAAFWHLPALLLALAWRAPAGPRLRRSMTAAAIALAGTYVVAYHIEPYRLEVTRREWSHPGLAGMAGEVVIAQVSDIQTDSVGRYERRVIDELARADPDLILYTGDYVHVGPEDLQRYERLLADLRRAILSAGLRPRFGSFAVAGDTEHDRPWHPLFEETSVRILDDEVVVLDLAGARVNLVGLSPRTSRDPSGAALRRVLAGRDESLLDVIFGHSPDFVQTLDRTGPPFLAIAGHTHGGQVRLPWAGALLTLTSLPRRYADAFASYGPGWLSVSRGIGMERRDAPRLRFLCRPELRLITLSPGQPLS